VPFTRVEPSEPTKPASIRLPQSLYDYLAKHGLTETIIQAVKFDRDLGELLEPLSARIDAVAKNEGLRRERDAAAIVAKLVVAGLNAIEAEQGKKPKK
jgi:hypothetical protein